MEGCEWGVTWLSYSPGPILHVASTIWFAQGERWLKEDSLGSELGSERDGKARVRGARVRGDREGKARPEAHFLRSSEVPRGPARPWKPFGAASAGSASAIGAAEAPMS